MWIIKLGGSLLPSGQLAACLSIIVQCAKAKVVVVPGGGVFADQIRHWQRQWAFDDQVAHRMALLAMEQYAWVLKAHDPNLVPCSSLFDITQAIERERVALWLPSHLTIDYPTLPEDWTVTSDSLALWLAETLGDAALILVKSIAADGMNVRQLVAAGRLDEYFPTMREQSDQAIWWLNVGEIHKLQHVLTGLLPPEDCFHAISL